jgi:hypothetical protein
MWVVFKSGGQLISLGKVEEFCLLTEYLEGGSYSHDLERIRDSGATNELDLVWSGNWICMNLRWFPI